jgi:glucose-1-phosphate cytidylyltransferase
LKAVILAGGLGTRISEETHLKPKPMIEVGGKPILWHIMKSYSVYGINDFIICSGYLGNIIEDYFNKNNFGWKINVVDTGLNSMTGGRLKRIQNFVGNETFCFTYGDTLNDVNIKDLIEFHKKNNTIATVTSCIPPEKYGVLYLEDNKVVDFKEKPDDEKNWVNGGFFVLEPSVFSFIKDDNTIWEKEPMEKIVEKRQLSAFRHTGFYQPMDTLNDKNHLEKLWNGENPPWKKWK